MTEVDWSRLEAAWQPAREAGVIGPAPLSTLIQHAAGFVPAAWRVGATFSAIDLGTGAGVPGLLLAVLHPRSRWLLVDASERRAAMAQRAVAAMALEDRVEVVHRRAEDVARDPANRARADLVVARLFGDPAEVAECAGPLVRAGGRVVVSVTEETEGRWRGADPVALAAVGLGALDVWGDETGRYLSVLGTGDASAAYPRRPPARRRSPLF